jgi:hypothetical protein
MPPTDAAQQSVNGSWWTVAAGWALYAWSVITDGWNAATHGMPPLAALVAFATLVLTVVKIAQEIRAWKRSEEERSSLQKLVRHLGAKSGFGDSK